MLNDKGMRVGSRALVLVAVDWVIGAKGEADRLASRMGTGANRTSANIAGCARVFDAESEDKAEAG